MKFDSKVQKMKYQTLKEVIKAAYNNKLGSLLAFGNRSEAEIERIWGAVGGLSPDAGIIHFCPSACHACGEAGFKVTNACRGCSARHCEVACKFGAINRDENGRAVIDKEKCVNCGLCAKSCRYHAIINEQKPCKRACEVGAIKSTEDGKIVIDESKCISCGACIYECPFGAIVDVSMITSVVGLLKNSVGEKIYAMIAPSIAGQFGKASVGQIATALKKLGFTDVIETALGADMVSIAEAQELYDKGILLSSCCPAFVDYVKKFFPEFEEDISTHLSPMGTLGCEIKMKDKDAKIVFIGPCTAKKMEIKKPEVKRYIDYAITFEELLALFDVNEINLESLEEEKIEHASYFGRRYAKNCGLSDAIKQSLSEQRLRFDVKPVMGNGIASCKTALLKAKAGRPDGNFIEGMACVGGCMGGACMISKTKNQSYDKKYFDDSAHKKITDAVLENLNGKKI